MSHSRRDLLDCPHRHQGWLEPHSHASTLHQATGPLCPEPARVGPVGPLGVMEEEEGVRRGWGGCMSLAGGFGATSHLGSVGADRPRRLHANWLLVVLGGRQTCLGDRGPGCLLRPTLRPSRDPQSLCSGSLLKAEQGPGGMS